MDLPSPTFGPPAQVPSADASVRSARPSDAEGIGRVQAEAWRASYARVLTPELIAALDPTALAEIWREAIAQPPTRSHRLLVAEAAGALVGFAATGPSDDGGPDDGELVALVVAPDAQHAGHGSRLLNAAADQLRQSGFGHVVTWVLSGDDVRRAFLTGAGFVADGVHRTFEGATIASGELREVRLVASLAPIV